MADPTGNPDVPSDAPAEAAGSPAPTPQAANPQTAGSEAAGSQAAGSQTAPSGSWLNVPNAISIIRILVLVPLVIWLMVDPDWRIAATIALAVFGATDWIDGFWARRYGQVTRVGEVLDPVADRLGIAIICVAMTLLGILPMWMLVVIVVTDVGLGIVGAIRIRAVAVSRVSWLGKFRTALIMVGLPLLLLSTDSLLADTPLYSIATFILSAGCFLHLAAGVDYALRLLRTPRAEPKASGSTGAAERISA